jgi:hypothetical protein
VRAAPVLIAAVCTMSFAQAGGCVAESGAHTAALVELYTAKACKACRQAERWLSELNTRAAPAVLPVLLHVDARDYHEDRPAHRGNLTPLQRLALAHSPRVLLQGREFRSWNTSHFDAALLRIGRLPAQARIRLEIVSLRADGIEAQAAAQVQHSGGMEGAALYLAAYADGPRGALVLEWQGPFAPGSDAPVRRMLPFPPGTAAKNSGVLGFVQDRRTAEVLQTLRLPSC